MTPIKAIRAKCLDCCCNQTAEVRECQNTGCSLHPYRMGRRPKDSMQDDPARKNPAGQEVCRS